MTEMTYDDVQRCEQCGRSRVPLDTVHVKRPCAECGETVYVAEPGEGGRGIQVLAGDSLTIPGHIVRDMSTHEKLSIRVRRPGDFIVAAYRFI